MLSIVFTQQLGFHATVRPVTGYHAAMRPALVAPARLPLRLASAVMLERSVWPAMDDDTPAEIIEAAADRVFAQLDTDGSGDISDDELRAYLKSMNFEDELITTTFTKIDTDPTDNAISASEFRAALVKYPTLRKALAAGEINAAADAVFTLLDADGNGTISDAELRGYLKGFDYDEALIDKMMKGMDFDASGEVDKEELRKAFNKYPSLRTAPGLGGAVKA